MKKITLIFALLLIAAQAVWAQRTVKGTVSDDAGTTLPGASVTVDGTTNGVTTDFNGKYEIKVPEGATTLVFRFLGYTDQRKEIGTADVVDVVLLDEATMIDVVTVNALGLTENRDKSASSSSRVDGTSVVKSGETGVLQGIAGKSSGVLVTRSTGDPGSGGYIQIRGQSTITGNLQPLIVVDGMPINNSTLQTEGNTGGVVEQSRLNDLNPDDIETLEVLKGAAAAAQWGTRAANGVIVITTKKGKGLGEKSFDVNFRTTFSIDKISQRHDLQDTYGQGSRGSWVADTGNSWGDKLSDRAGGNDDVDNTSGVRFEGVDGNVIYPILSKNSQESFLESNFDAVFRNGWFTDNSISFSGGDLQSNFFVSISDLNQKGIIRNNSDYHRTTFRVNADRRFNDFFKMSVNATYAKTGSNRIQTGSNIAGLYLGLLRTSPDYDIRTYKGVYYNAAGVAGVDFDEDGNPLNYNHRSYRRYLGNSTPTYNNPLWTINEQSNISNVNRFIVGTEVQIDPLSWLNITGRFGVDAYNDGRTTNFPVYSSGNGSGYLLEDRIVETQFNTDVFARASHNINKNIGITGMVGFNFNDRRRDWVTQEIQGFTLPNYYGGIENSAGGSSAVYDFESTIRTAAVYATLGVDLFDMLFWDISGRAESASTFGANAKSTFFYPSTSLAWVFTKLMDKNDILTHGKLRLAYGVVGVQPPPYITRTDYTSASISSGWGPGLDPGLYGNGSFVQDEIQGNDEIRPERKSEVEAGVDLRFFKDKINLGFTYYNSKTKDAIFDVDVPASTGFTSKWDNAGTLTNKGIEIELGADVLDLNGFKWNLFANFSRNRNLVVDLQGVTSIFLAGFTGTSSRAVEGEALGALWGGRWDRDANGTLILDENGFPQAAEEEGVIGDPNPDWRGGLGSTLSYKGVNLSFLFETAQGQDMWAGTFGVLNHFGVAKSTDVESTHNTDLTTVTGGTIPAGEPFRGEVRDFGGGNVALDQSWYQSLGGGFGPVGEQFIQDGSWTRLREVALSYRINGENFRKKSKLDFIEIGLTGRNLLLWTPFQGNDPDQNLTGPTNGRGLEYFTNPGSRSYLLTLKINY